MMYGEASPVTGRSLSHHARSPDVAHADVPAPVLLDFTSRRLFEVDVREVVPDELLPVVATCKGAVRTHGSGEGAFGADKREGCFCACRGVGGRPA